MVTTIVFKRNVLYFFEKFNIARLKNTKYVRELLYRMRKNTV